MVSKIEILRMKGSFVFPGFEDDCNYEFDPQTDFSQFLEEAKSHASNFKETRRAENGPKQAVLANQDVVTKTKKSWKNVVFPFWRTLSEKKSKKHSKETSRNVHATYPTPARASVSGPIYGTGATSGGYRNNLLGSGPVTGLIQPKKREEDDIPYVCLDELNKPINDASVYGPVYLVS